MYRNTFKLFSEEKIDIFFKKIKNKISTVLENLTAPSITISNQFLKELIDFKELFNHKIL